MPVTRLTHVVPVKVKFGVTVGLAAWCDAIIFSMNKMTQVTKFAVAIGQVVVTEQRAWMVVRLWRITLKMTSGLLLTTMLWYDGEFPRRYPVILNRPRR